MIADGVRTTWRACALTQGGVRSAIPNPRVMTGPRGNVVDRPVPRLRARDLVVELTHPSSKPNVLFVEKPLLNIGS
jgi:hypothetical protein